MEQFNEHVELNRLEYNLRKAEIECALPSELFARVRTLWEDPYSTEIIARILEIKLSPEDQGTLERAVLHLIQTSETLPYKEKAKADRRLKRLILALPYHSALEIAKELINHHRKLRRNIGFDVLKTIGVDKDLGEEFISRFEETGNEEFLQLVARSAQAVPKLDYVYLLEHLSERYWRMRVFEALLFVGSDLATDLVHKYPFEFTYAAGRLKHRDSLESIRMLFQENQTDLDFLSICTWTVGQLRAREELEVLKPVVERRIGETVA